jgi:Tfp pilus assembly protein PilF
LPRTWSGHSWRWGSALSEFRSTDARQAFEKAISLDSADPLAHLGLGLARISSGELEEGRRGLEVAVALDSNSALLRAYLGKAYFEEKRTSLDAQQFAIAKELDPLDPTAYLYDGIREQTANRPVEALRDFEKSRALNDNRATYRGRLLLDKDRAARGVSLARVYNDLGFTQLGTNEAAQSLALDPSNASAHRFLSDSYRDSSRQEISRVSELLQAQLLQDINIAPIQPSLGETSIATRGGPASVGFNEFTPLFQRNLTEVDASALAGTNATRSGELAVSGVHGPWSLSAGAFTYRTDGFRPNNDLMHNAYNVFAQVAASPEVNLQAEFRRRNTRSGDLVAQFALDSFLPGLRRTFDEDSARVGVRITPGTRSTFLLSAISSDRTEAGSVLDDASHAPFSYAFSTRTREKANQVEGQYLFQEKDFNLIAGVSSARASQHLNMDQSYYMTVDPSINFPIPPSDVSPNIEDVRGYAYGNLRIAGTATGTLGLSYGNYRDDTHQLTVHRLNPKAGARWDLTPVLQLRVAGFRAVKPPLATNRTLEPAQIAGFNQLFDDVNATRSTGYGAGLDWHVSKDVAAGVELTQRKFEEPVLVNNVAQSEDRHEWRRIAYVYWTPAPRWSLRAEAVHDRYESDEASLDANRPRYLKTVTVPLQLRYFRPDGFFGGLVVTLVDQALRRGASSTLPEGREKFAVTDFVAGFRLPRRMGLVSIGVFNLFDRQFMFQGDAYRATQDEAKGTPYVPQRTVMGRISLNF